MRSCSVVRGARRDLLTARQPLARMIRSLVRRATGIPRRCRCAHIFRLPYNDSGARLPLLSGSWMPARISVIVASHNARFDVAADRRAQ